MSNIKLIGAVGIKVRPDTDGFKAELKGQLKELQSYDIEVNVDADTTIAKRKIEKARKEEEAKALNLKVGVDYDSINAARNQIKSALQQLKLENIPVNMDEPSLNKALAKMERLRKSAKVDMEINEDKAGYEAVLAKIRTIQRQKIAQTITFKTDNKSLEAEARKYEKLLADLAPAKTITITHRNDHESLDAAVKQIDEALAKLKEVTLKPIMDEEHLLAEKAKLEKKLASTPLIMHVAEDKEGYEAVLKKIVELQKQAATTPIGFKTDEKSLAVAAAKMRAKIAALTPKPKITFSYDNDTPGLTKAIEEVDRKIAELGQINLTADLDLAGLKDAKKKLEESLAKSSFSIKLDENNLDQLERERKRIEDMLSAKHATTIIDVKNDEVSLEEARRKLDDLIKERKAPIRADPITWEAALQLAYASRARDVPFYVRINQRSLAVAEGVLQSLAGINVLRESGLALESLVTKFDQISIKTGALGALIGGLANAFIYLTTALFPVGEGILQSVGILAMAPAALSALTATVLINVAAWQDFGDAVEGNAEALAKLPPEAQKTALALRGTWTEIQKPVQASFWKGMGSAMADSFKAFIPIVATGLSGAAEHVGRFGAGVFKAFEKIAYAGGPLETMLGNLSQGFDNGVGAAEPLVDAMNTLGLRGSEYLPRFGTWLTEITTQFDKWITKADEAGRINVWIDQGIQSLRDMWSLGGGTIKMFQGITKAAKEAGAGGLGDVAKRFNEIGDIMLREPFQSRLSTIFDGARRGATELNVGVKALGLTLGESSLFVANLLSGLGQLGGGALTGLSQMLGNITFQTGVLRGLTDMNIMVQTLQSGFFNLGSVIGNLSRIAGSAFSSIGPVINQLISLLDVVVGTLRDDLINTIPGLMSLVGGLIAALSGPIQFMAEALANVLSWVNSMGGPMQSLLLSFAAFLLLGSKIGPMFAVKSGGLLEKITYDFGQADTARQKFAVGMKGMGAGLLGAFGGPWGIAIGAAVTGLALMGQSAAEQKAQVDSLTATLDANTGAITRNTAAAIAKSIVDQRNDGFYLFESGAKSASETLVALGKSVQSTAQIVAEGGKPYDDMIAKLEEGRDALAASGLQFDAAGNATQGNSDALEAWANQMNISKDAVSQMDLEGLIEHLKGQRGATDRATDGWKLMNDAADVGEQRVKDFNVAMGIYNDTTGTADQRTRALKAALDVLSGKQPSVEEAQLKVNDAMRAAAGEMSNVDGVMKLTGGAWRDASGTLLNFNGVIDAHTGKIDTASTAGANLYRNLQSTTNGVLETATAMKDAHAPIEDITKFLDQSRQAYIDQGVAAGMNGEVVAAAYDRMIGANPKDLLTTITAQGVEEAEGKVRNFQGTVDEIDGRKAVVAIMGDNVPLGVKLEESLGSLEAFDAVVATATAGLDPTQADAVRLRIEEDLLNLAAKRPTVLADMDPALLNRKKEEAERNLNDLARMKPSPTVNAEISDAQSKLQTILNLIANIKPKNVDITTTWKEIGSPPSAPGMRMPAMINAFGSLTDAKGSFPGGFRPQFGSVQAFANGGIVHEKPGPAKIYAPVSKFRVFSEATTGGEAYIPLSMSKRARSTAILEQVAAQFGMRLSSTQSFEHGGIVSNDRTGGGVSVSIGSYNTQASDTPDDVARALMRRVKTAGVYTPLEGF